MGKCQLIDTAKTQDLLKNQKAILIDIRGKDEHARENIAAAKCIPVSELHTNCFDGVDKNTPIIFHCRSGARTEHAQSQFEALGFKHVYILDGGITAWKQSGGQVRVDTKQPLPLMRQVQIIIGFMVLLGIVLSYLVSPYFNLLSAFFGAGLIFAGVTGFCGLAKVLMLLPYNKQK